VGLVSSNSSIPIYLIFQESKKSEDTKGETRNVNRKRTNNTMANRKMTDKIKQCLTKNYTEN
jgi:hypothetical protein